MQKFFTGKPGKTVANGNAAASSEMEDGNASYYVCGDDLFPSSINCGQKGFLQSFIKKPSLFFILSVCLSA